MASFKLRLDKHVKRNGKQSILLQIIVDRKVIPRTTGLEVLAKHWDAARERVKAGDVNFTEKNDALARKLTDAEREFAKTVAIGIQPTARTIANKVAAQHDFYKHVESLIKLKTGPTQERSQASYRTTLNSLRKYVPELKTSQITSELIDGYRRFMESLPRSKKDQRPLSKSTVAKRLQLFRAMYNESPHRANPSPFNDVVVGTVGRANIEPLTIAEIAKLWAYQPRNPGEAHARDMFLFSFYAAGMRIGDVILMKWAYVRPDRIRYPQSKKEHLDDDPHLDIPLNQYTRAILKRTPKDSEYVFNCITATDPRKIRRQKESNETLINRSLKVIAVRCKIDKWIAGKVARKTFSDIANKKSKRDIYSIQQAMGHEKISTTEGYLGKDQTAINALLKKVYGSSN